MEIAYLNYGAQSGVTRHVAAALRARGHVVADLCATGPLEPRDARTRRPRLTAPVAIHLAMAAARFGAEALSHRWNTGYAFDQHTRRAGALLAALDRPPEVVLQNGALFAPGERPPLPYVLLCDHTRLLAQESPAFGEARLEPTPDYGPGWFAREERVYQGAAAICTFSANTAGSFTRHYGVARERVHVVGGGANVFPEAVERHDDGETILFVGVDFLRKGGAVLVEAFERLRRRRPGARLLVAGPRERLALPAGAVQLGFVPFDELPALCAQASVFALPTLREPFGIAFLDAMACGLPCVGTRLEAVPEIVRDGLTGLLVPPADPGALAAALERLLAEPELARAMGFRGRERVAAFYRWELVAERLEAVLAAASHGQRAA
ncbi:MAG TPA: glycosyltransferase family 4 protein [Anaeromyxobacteraceae bacterium]|jgi:glycosyltransferase involved in cell wall biosynthesis|nr:glycosyltransferase family 4 protein [Anaeromyxobacteraceae bacterium]